MDTGREPPDPDCESGARARLLAAIFRHAADPDLGLVLLGAEVDALPMQERIALRARLAFLPAGGGLLSHLNAWENIVLPLGCHQPGRLPGIAAEVHAVLTGLGAAPDRLLGRLPEEMTLIENTAFAGYSWRRRICCLENFARLTAPTRRIPNLAASYPPSS